MRFPPKNYYELFVIMNTSIQCSSDEVNLSGWLQLLLAISCGFVIANLYYTQPIHAAIASSIGMAESKSGLLVTAVQVGYCFGMLLLVALGDIFDNKKLIPILLLCASLSLLAAGFTQLRWLFILSLFFVGFFSSASQVIVPFSVGLANPEERGKMAGLLIGGGMLGIILARPTASVISDVFGWRCIFFVASFLMITLSVSLAITLPKSKNNHDGINYISTLKSMCHLFVTTSGLKVRLFYMALFFLCFSIFWATIPLVLHDKLSFTPKEIALMSLVSAFTPICSILTGRLIDKGLGFNVIRYSCVAVGLAFIITPIFGFYVLAFAVSIVLLDPGISMTNVVIQQRILSINPQARSRLNAIFVAAMFLAGSLGSFLGPWMYHKFSWQIVCSVCIGLMTIASLVSKKIAH